MAICVEFFGARKELASITNADMDDFIIWMTDRGYAPSTIRQKVCVMTKAFRHFHRRGNLKTIPKVELPKIGDNTRDRIITEAEFTELCRLMRDALPGERGAEFAALWTVLVDTGARPSELRKVTRGDIRGDLMTLKGNRKAPGRKANNKKAERGTKSGLDRTIPLTERAARAMDVLIQRHGEQPFEWATSNNMRYGWDFGRERMGLSGDPGFIPYALRHTCATRLYDKTRDLMLVQRWLGHADLTMTLRYAKLQPTDLQKARDLLEA